MVDRACIWTETLLPVHWFKWYRARPMHTAIDNILRRAVPFYRIKRKHEAELGYWRNELLRLKSWFIDGSTDWWGIRPPSASERLNASPLWQVNAVMTMHALRPSYAEELRIERDHLKSQRVLEIGCGPLAPILQFTDCERHCVDPLINMYLTAGWPLFAYDARFVNTVAESMPYPDAYFDAAISVNALDHVDDFEKTAAETERVVRPGGHIYFEVEYHAATVTEPIVLDDLRIIRAFAGTKIKQVINRTGAEMFEALVARFGLLNNQARRFGTERFVTWHGVRR